MEDTSYDAIVVGSGPGGASCATLLQKRGIRTLIVEKNDFVGGKMVSIEKDGYAYDLFPHGQVPMRGSQFEAIFDELGVRDEFEPALEPDDDRDIIKIAYRKRGWDEYRFTVQGQAMADPTPFFKLWDMDTEAEQKVLAFMTGLVTMPEEEIDRLDDLTMHEYLIEQDVPFELYSYLAFHANASLAEPIDLVSASEQVRIMRQMMLQGGGGQYKGGFGTLAKVMIREFEKNGGTMITNARVEKIVIENGAATGVVTAQGTFRAPIVVSSAGIQPTVLKLVGEEHFDRSYANYVKGLVPGWAFTSVRYFLDKPVMDVAMYVAYADESWIDMERFIRMKEGHIPDEVILFMVNHSFYDEKAAPPGKQVLVSGTICSPDPDAKEIEGLWKVMDKQMQRFFPEIWAATERREYAGPREISSLTRDAVLPGQGGECVGLGQVVGQCGRDKPSVTAPIRGLYYAGTDAGAAGMGTHQATLSGTEVARLVGHELRRRQKMQ
ncbi:MAG: NAD(P)/FAD-dependent oxidoreductase [Deltaproteobacteria bacterium]|nr:NAD(P)/FAD-dependent oxidoreductase [Deltaproteobacteria bacterium]MBW2392679.1 NAD(P)/FAD-dependent oxidoreductase [Deltaproteobacteria bacterium]